ncbi:MAG: flavodoxin [Bacteroidaceae bacterium]|nr:flavodoxin [Bacteroidaceae bacterium]
MRKSLILAMMAMVIASCTAKDKVLIAYFSASGTTKTLAQELAEKTGADLFEIEGAQPYTSEDVNLGNREARAFKEMADKSFRPEVKDKPKKLKQYDVVYIGFPIWGNAAPNIICSFIEQNDLKGKTVITFSTSGSSDLSNSHRLLKEQYPDLNWVEGVTLKRNPTAEDRQKVLVKLAALSLTGKKAN